ncbi:hypothetical protein I310019A7_06180 [Lawsonibacter asaccharolyticus]
MANTEIFLRNIFGTTRPNIRPLVLALNITNDLLFEQHISMSDIKATKHIYPDVARLLHKKPETVYKSVIRLAHRCWDALVEQDLVLSYLGRSMKQEPDPSVFITYLAVYIQSDIPFFEFIERDPGFLFRDSPDIFGMSDIPPESTTKLLLRNKPLLVPGLTNNSYGKMLTWLNNFAYSKAVDGNGELSNSRIRTFFRHSDVSLKAIYEEKQEKASGGYYSVATLSSAYDGKQNKAAKVVVNLSGIRTNLTNNTNAYFFVGMHSGTNTFECGLQLRKSGSSYKWYAICNSTLDKFETLSATPIANINGGGNVTVELVKEDGKITSTVYYNNVEKCSKVYKDSQFAASRSNEFYRTISFCPHDSNDNPTPNLNNGEYFTGTAFKECYIKRGSDSYVAWNYNSSFNQYAVAFNDEFIDVSVGSTEKADISYKGRDNNSKLIVT